MTERRYWLHEMTRAAFEEYLQAQPKPVVIIPLGSIEQHGPHLPLGTDILGALHVTELTARKADAVGVFTTLAAFSPHHMGFKGTITLRAETLDAYLYDVFASLAHHGVKRIMVLNMHGGNEEILSRVVRTAARDLGVIIAKPRAKAFSFGPEDIEELGLHANESETSTVLATHPELVEIDRVKDFEPTEDLPDDVKALLSASRPDAFLSQQIAMMHLGDTHTHTSSGVWGFGHPQKATAEYGEKFFRDLSDEYAEFIKLWRTVDIEGEGGR